MATVYVATDLRLERRVALKVMHHHLSDDERFQTRFILEARAAARLSDPHVVGVFDQGQDDDIAYLVMEYLPGVTLRDLLNEQKRLSLEQTITIMHAILEGLASAHRAGLIHRDVKPENVLLAEDGRIKIGDFGLARVASANTATGQQLLGTIAYLAPELVTQGTADARTDIYALGIMLYEMLAGDQPYLGEQPMQIAYQHATEQVPRPSIKNPGVPEQLDELVMWSTEREPDERPADAAMMLARLVEIEREIGIKPIPIAPPSAGPARDDKSDLDGSGDTTLLPETGATSILAPTGPLSPGGGIGDNATQLRRRTRRRATRGWWAAIIVVAMAIAAGGTGWWFGSGPGSMIAVPSIAAQTPYEEAEGILAAVDLRPVAEQQPSLDVPAGTVIALSPGSGERLYPGDLITVTVSSGPAAVTIDSLRGLTLSAAEQHAEDAVITVRSDPEEIFTDAEAGTIIGARLHPSGSDETIDCIDGCQGHQADELSVTLSAGQVPDVHNVSVQEARERLEEAGLTVSEETERHHHEEISAGLVIGIVSPGDDVQLRRGDSVTLRESIGPQPHPIPDVVGMNRDEAVATLENAGFSVSYSPLLNGLPSSWVIVSSTDPAPGTERVPRETTVHLSLNLAGPVS